ncbi:putative phospholipase B-like 2, partial [Dermacentor silvarum]|uniref:putative phospholipase B-like 2 n=1 Tax=Dermacentor silvarum TaxID=543639 RepID=UPI002101436B
MAKGWSYLQVESNERVRDDLQAYAAGALEAHLTRRRMEEHWANIFSSYCTNQAEYCRKLEDFAMQNINYTREQQHQLRHKDPFWNMIVGDFDDLYIAHDTWFVYRGMLRVQKKYIFPWHRTSSETTP